ncbi:MAG: hypothetical protein V1735_03125 [Nanoarchaeota archaeon]
MDLEERSRPVDVTALFDPASSPFYSTIERNIKPDVGIVNPDTGAFTINPEGFRPGQIQALLRDIQNRFPEGVWLYFPTTNNYFNVRSLVLCVPKKSGDLEEEGAHWHPTGLPIFNDWEPPAELIAKL